ncbi:hypothetical protein SAMD00024442_6_25 [Candidatus Symbiothrix dinenymphae]|nr:hypothetical protein SAMD00024442_6_25 [Candidatus Symbiothrix dinenymphae]
MHSEAVHRIKPVRENPTQAFYTDKFQLFDTIEVLLNQLSGKCDALYMTSFSISEEFIRKIFKFKKEMQIGRIILILDTKAAIGVTKILPFAKNVFDEVYLTNNHGKVILFETEELNISIGTSQNQTRGNRREATLITTDPDCFNSFRSEVAIMMKNGVKL